MGDGPVARVLVDSPLPQLDQLFDYRVPERLLESARAGVRVRVPLRSGGRIADGWLVELVDRSDYDGRLSELEDVVGAVPVLRPEVWALARAVADRAAGVASDVLRLAIPPRYVRAERAWVSEHGGSDSPEASVAQPEASVAPVAVTGYEPGRLEAAIAAGERVALVARPGLRELPSGEWVGGWAITLAEAAAHTVAGGRSAILAVPDHRDQDQLEAALRALLPPARILRTDARQTGPARYRAFLDTTTGPFAIIGNRSAVYAPARVLGLIALWDDGDPLFAEQLSPGVHARDVALVRQEQTGAALVLAAHARSVEVARLVELGWLVDVRPVRGERPRVVPTEQQSDAGPARIPTAAWRYAQEAVLTGPVLVQVARPGHTPLLVCDRCREPARCTACAGAIAIPSSGGAAACTLCGTPASGWRCPVCDGVTMRAATVGATRTAEELGRAFPRARVILSDGERQVLRVGAEPALVVATRGAEPIADGGYRAILLLDGERMLLRESLRVAEDCLRWWSDAAALAAPGASVFLVGVGGTLATALATWRQPDWAVAELATRRALRFPPAVRVASITAARDRVRSAAEVAESAAPGVDVLGPLPADDGLERAIVRFDYGAGAAVAAALRAESIRVATERRRPVAGRGPGRAPVLRIRFDDPAVP